MQLGDFVKTVTNSTNNQNSFVLRKRALKAAGISPTQLLDIKLPPELSSPNPHPSHQTTFNLKHL